MDNLEEVLIEMLSKTYSNIVYSEDRILKEMIGDTLSIKEMHTLEVVYSAMLTKNNTAGAIAKKLGITLGTCTINIDRLIAKGLVSRIKNEKDRRVVYIELTEKGLQTHIKHSAMHKKIISKAIDRLSMSEKVALLNAVNKLEIY